MSYIGIIPAITITQQDAGDIDYQEVSVSDDTNFVLDFPDADVAQEVTVEFTLTGAYAITWGDSNSLPIQWLDSGGEPSLSTGKHLIRFYYDGNGEVFGEILGLYI